MGHLLDDWMIPFMGHMEDVLRLSLGYLKVHLSTISPPRVGPNCHFCLSPYKIAKKYEGG